MVYLFLADGFEEVEALTPVDYLRRAEIQVTTVGVTGEFVTGTRGIVVKADNVIEEVCGKNDIEMLIMPGGLGGTNNMENSNEVIKMINDAYERGAYIAAICAAPTILAKIGLLEDKECICYPNMAATLAEFGGRVKDEDVVIDGNIITSKAAGTAEQFALKLIEVLKDKETSENVRRSIYAREF